MIKRGKYNFKKENDVIYVYHCEKNERSIIEFSILYLDKVILGLEKTKEMLPQKEQLTLNTGPKRKQKNIIKEYDLYLVKDEKTTQAWIGNPNEHYASLMFQISNNDLKEIIAGLKQIKKQI